MPQRVEKPPSRPFLTPVRELKTPLLWCFGLVSGLFWTAGWADNDFFNRLARFRQLIG